MATARYFVQCYFCEKSVDYRGFCGFLAEFPFFRLRGSIRMISLSIRGRFPGLGPAGWILVFWVFSTYGERFAGSGGVAIADEPSLRVVFVGDIMLDNGPGHWVGLEKDPFERCAELLRGADLRVGNLECVLGDEGERRSKPYVFRAASGSELFLKRHFDALSLANNHSLDYGPEGLVGCMEILQKVGLPYFGGGRNLKESRRPLILERKGKRISLLGFNEFYADAYAAQKKRAGNTPLNPDWVIADIKKSREEFHCDIVIPFFHWGEELEAQPRPDQRELARRCIEAGATAVIGAHPHIPQTIDYHRGKPIVYSLGNFVFDYYAGDPAVWLGWVATLDISNSGDVDLRIDAVEMDSAGIPTPVVPSSP